MGILDLIRQRIREDIDADIKELEKVRGSVVLCLYSSIDRSIIDWANEVCQSEKKKKVQTEKLDVIINSGGGDIDAAYHLAKIFDEIPKKELNYIVPRYAKSAATLLACGGDNIFMGETSELGPLDPQIIRPDGSRFSALAVKQALKLLKDEFKDDNLETATIMTHKLNPIDLGEIDRTIGISKKYLSELLNMRMFKGKKGSGRKIQKIAEVLASGYTHHSYLIDAKEAKEKLGLVVKRPKDQEADIIKRINIRHNQVAEIDGIANQLQEYQILKKFTKRRM